MMAKFKAQRPRDVEDAVDTTRLDKNSRLSTFITCCSHWSKFLKLGKYDSHLTLLLVNLLQESEFFQKIWNSQIFTYLENV